MVVPPDDINAVVSDPQELQNVSLGILKITNAAMKERICPQKVVNDLKDKMTDFC